MDPADGNILMRSSGVLEEVRALLGDDVDAFPAQLVKRRISEAALTDAAPL
nr:hypothetical protein [Microbacterium humi]